MKALKLLENVHGRQENEWPLTSTGVLTVGRKDGGADIGIGHESISRKHCTLSVRVSEEVTVTIQDLKSTNGTFVNGRRLAGGESVTLKHNPAHTIGLGECKHTFSFLEEGSGPESESKSRLENPLQEIVPSQQEPVPQQGADAKEASRILKVAMPSHASPPALRAIRLLAEQCTVAIDYKSLAMSYDHPISRMEYRSGTHASFKNAKSRARSEASKKTLAAMTRSCQVKNVGAAEIEKQIVRAFMEEIGSTVPLAEAQFDAVLAALEVELVHPLRAINDAQKSMHVTSRQKEISPGKIKAAVNNVTKHVVKGDFSKWRYSNDVGVRQLEGLSASQIAKWSEPTRIEHENGMVTHEDGPGELGFFWATKIGDAPHGFDVEGQCLLALVSNARNKVILVSDAAWPHYPAGRAYFRVLWTPLGKPGADTIFLPLLWLEGICRDGAAAAANVDHSSWEHAVVRHAIGKAEAMGVKLSIDPQMQRSLEGVLKERGVPYGRQVHTTQEKIQLRPSNGVVEASDELTERHDWLALKEEILSPERRCVYTPVGVSAFPLAVQSPTKKQKL